MLPAHRPPKNTQPRALRPARETRPANPALASRTGLHDAPAKRAYLGFCEMSLSMPVVSRDTDICNDAIFRNPFVSQRS